MYMTEIKKKVALTKLKERRKYVYIRMSAMKRKGKKRGRSVKQP
jgi:hypothetical protein